MPQRRPFTDSPGFQKKLRTVYNILFTIFFALASPYYFWRLRRRGDWQRGFAQRFGKYDAPVKQALTNRHILWIHAVSVGEVNLCTQLIHALEPRVPNIKFVVSCTTTTGMRELQRRLPSRVTRIYYPVDLEKITRRALATVNPQAVVLIEAEIWPNFLWRADDLGLPVFLANARLSPRSFPRYKRFGWLFRPLFRSFVGVSCQNEDDAHGLIAVGCKPQAVRVVGNMKFDAAAKFSELKSLDARKILLQAGWVEGAPVIVAGSTHDGEELLLVEIARRLRAKFPELFLVIVPRHFERCKDLVKKFKARGIKSYNRTDIFRNVQLQPGEIECLLVNTTGELKFFYELADVVFVGKSLMAEGGQNPIEPAALGKAVVFGPHMENFTDIARAFLAAQAVVQVADAEELEQAFGELLAAAPRRAVMGSTARAVVADNLGAVTRTVQMILPFLEQRGMHVLPPGEDAVPPANE
jgi:3-deoxy-D-manno-octulosonic-acid transferase